MSATWQESILGLYWKLPHKPPCKRKENDNRLSILHELASNLFIARI